ncbi:hypothetical protein HC891_05340 [Candidatus Gracilibacteria bacterium]|nr:hypothetical protein [Candidatus Gracilibacteria bacterium]
MLIVLTGPVGAGKSTTSVALAQALRSPAVSVAVIDLDQMYGFVRQQDGYGDLTTWTRARRGAAALAHALFEADMSVVIVEGEFFTAEQLHALVAPIPSTVVRHFFTLRLSYEHALERVKHDAARGASKDPAFLRSVHNDFLHALPFLAAASVVIDTDPLTQAEVVACIVAAVLNQGANIVDCPTHQGRVMRDHARADSSRIMCQLADGAPSAFLNNRSYAVVSAQPQTAMSPRAQRGVCIVSRCAPLQIPDFATRAVRHAMGGRCVRLVNTSLCIPWVSGSLVPWFPGSRFSVLGSRFPGSLVRVPLSITVLLLLAAYA